MEKKYPELQRKSCRLRRLVLDMVFRARAGHIGGDYSVCDILNVLYNLQMNITPETFGKKGTDHFILSKGHSVEALYAVLYDKGFLSMEDLESFSQFGSKLIGHPNNKVPGIEMNSGSLGHGLSVAVGMALAERMDRTDSRVYVVMGDGELAEGSVWEGAMAAGHYKLSNLCAVIDRNGLQISGTTEEVMSHANLDARWRSFGWNVLRTAGNDIEKLDRAFEMAKECKDKPTVIIAETTKGCGVSFMENKAPWHHRVPTQEEYLLAVRELEEKEASIQ
ncbi:MAG: transketolase [Clostridia bacterium]|nr:transketolase [Clostridia bacterium]MBQ7152631.1 transketolase [Clostridia bacterium]MBR3196243.1 transketolase [Clostridia bacterium]